MSIQTACLAQIKPCIKYPMKLCPVTYCQNKCVSHVERMRGEERKLFPVGNPLVVSLILHISSVSVIYLWFIIQSEANKYDEGFK